MSDKRNFRSASAFGANSEFNQRQTPEPTKPHATNGSKIRGKLRPAPNIAITSLARDIRAKPNSSDNKIATGSAIKMICGDCSK
jgi:hypothetical protein